jgi:porin
MPNTCSRIRSLPIGRATSQDRVGVRAELASRGMAYGSTNYGEVFGNASGGIERGSHFFGHIDVQTNIDLEKLCGWNG